MNREELIELVKKIIDDKETEEGLSKDIQEFKRNVPHPSPTNLIYHEDLTPEEIVEKALNNKPFQL